MTGTKAKRAQAVNVVVNESITEELSRKSQGGRKMVVDSSGRVYIDIVFISRINIVLRLKGL